MANLSQMEKGCITFTKIKDPKGSQWWEENGNWQDGCTILQQSPTTFTAFLNKFSSQAHCTDERGHPIWYR